MVYPMVHDRRIQPGTPQTVSPTAPAQGRPASMPAASATQGAFAQLQADIRALNSSVLILSQKMQYLVRNEKILGRNLIVLSKRIREIEANGTASASDPGAGSASGQQLKDIALRVESLGQKLLETENELMDVKEHYAKNEMVKEMKYVVDTINPMDFVTLKQFDELLDQKLKKRK